MSVEFIYCRNAQEIGDKVAALFILQVRSKPESIFILATGSSPLFTYRTIVNDYAVNKTDWSRAITFNLDEYLNLRQNYSDQSYRHFMNVNLFNDININKKFTFFPSLEFLGDKYQKHINKFGAVDLALLGVGQNGHIAFNEPGTPINSMTHVVNLTETSRKDNARFFDNDIRNVPTQAVTMGFNEILRAKRIVLISTGANKKNAIDHLLRAKDFDQNWPITALLKHNNVIVFTDTNPN